MLLQNANYQITIDAFTSKEVMKQSFCTCIELHQSKSLEEALDIFFNSKCIDGKQIKVIHSTDDYKGSLPQMLPFYIKMDNPLERFSYPEELDMTLYNLHGISCVYTLKALFAIN